MPADDQREIVARGEREILRASQDIRAMKAEIRRAERIERLAATCNQNTPFPTYRRYAVLYADPPWHFEVYNEESGIEHAAANHNPRCRSTRSALCQSQVSPAPTPHYSCGQRSRIFGSHSRCSMHGALNTRRISFG